VINVELSDHIFNPEHYIIPFANESPKIDGLDEDNNWANTHWTNPFVDITSLDSTDIPRYSTRVKMLWDSNFLYVYVRMHDPHIWGNLKQRDTVVYYNNDFELFMDPDGDTYNYGEIEVNALGTVWDLMLDKPYSLGGKANNHWNVEDLKYAIHVNGSINDNRDIDSFWGIEMAIPMEVLLELKSKPRKLPAEGEQWRMNFSRVQWEHELIGNKYERKRDGEKYASENNWVWSRQGAVNMHLPEYWGIVQFTHSNFTDSVDFQKSNTWDLTRSAYEAFRMIRFGELKDLLNKKPYKTAELEIVAQQNNWDAIFTKTKIGFELEIESRDLDLSLVINESGKLVWR